MEIELFRPMGDRVLLKVLPREERTASGILLPAARAGREDRGVVVAVGPGRWSSKGERLPMLTKPGDVVLFDPYRIRLVISAAGLCSTASAYAGTGDHAVVSELDITGIDGV